MTNKDQSRKKCYKRKQNPAPKWEVLQPGKPLYLFFSSLDTGNIKDTRKVKENLFSPGINCISAKAACCIQGLAVAPELLKCSRVCPDAAAAAAAAAATATESDIAAHP